MSTGGAAVPAAIVACNVAQVKPMPKSLFVILERLLKECALYLVIRDIMNRQATNVEEER